MPRKSRLRLYKDELELLHEYRRQRYAHPEDHPLGKVLADAIKDAQKYAELGPGDN